MTTSQTLERGRDAFDRRAWGEALSSFMAADRDAPLELPDLELLARAAYLMGRDEDATRVGTRVHRAAVEAGEIERAARAAFWLGMKFGQRGDMAQAGAWFGRAREVIEAADRECVESGYLLIPVGLGHLEGGDGRAAYEIFEEMTAVAERFGDPDLMTLGRLGRGQSLIALGEHDAGMRLLDDAMVSVTSGEASEVVAGIVYCAVVEACHRVLDMRRAQEWTEALARWCARQPDLVPYRGQCLVYRAELMRFHGDWTTADDEARRAQALLLGPPVDPGVGEALYQQAELHRLRGEVEKAERAYGEASRFGRSVDPGLPLLRLAQGRQAAARTMIRRALGEAPDDPRLLEAAIDIALAAGDVPAARAAADRLAQGTPATAPALLRAMAARAVGRVLLAEGDPNGALAVLRGAAATWQELDAPFEAARVRVSIAGACSALGDRETARLELDAARRVFEQLGAAPALEDVDRHGAARHDVDSALSARELEVLRRLAEGRTNREIAEDLGISDRTVDRHVSNLYVKLDVSSRAAATAWAYEHGLV